MSWADDGPSKTNHVPAPRYEKFWPKTLVLRATSAVDSLIYAMGGQNEDLFAASFVDRAEAEAWVQGCKQFGMEMVGLKQDGTARVDSGDVPQKTGGSSGGSVCEVQGVGEGGTGQAN